MECFPPRMPDSLPPAQLASAGRTLLPGSSPGRLSHSAEPLKPARLIPSPCSRCSLRARRARARPARPPEGGAGPRPPWLCEGSAPNGAGPPSPQSPPEPLGVGQLCRAAGKAPGAVLPSRGQANSAELPAAYPNPSCEGCETPGGFPSLRGAGPPEGSPPWSVLEHPLPTGGHSALQRG